jgi:hypothetical protein
MAGALSMVNTIVLALLSVLTLVNSDKRAWLAILGLALVLFATGVFAEKSVEKWRQARNRRA